MRVRRTRRRFGCRKGRLVERVFGVGFASAVERLGAV